MPHGKIDRDSKQGVNEMRDADYLTDWSESREGMMLNNSRNISCRGAYITHGCG